MKFIRKMFKKIKPEYLLIIVFLLVILICVTCKSCLLNYENFDNYKNKKCVALFYAPWCGHCKKIKPLWNDLETSHPGVTSVNCDEHSKIAEKHNIKGFPTIKYLPNGIDSSDNSIEYSGDRSEGDLKRFIDKYL